MEKSKEDLKRIGLDVTKNELLDYGLFLIGQYTMYVNNVTVSFDDATQRVSVRHQDNEINDRIAVLNTLLNSLAPLGEGGTDARFVTLMMAWEQIMMFWRWIYALTSSLEFYGRKINEEPETWYLPPNQMQEYFERRQLYEEIVTFGQTEIIPYGMMITHAIFKEKHIVPQYANVVVNQSMMGLNPPRPSEDNSIVVSADEIGKVMEYEQQQRAKSAARV